MATKRAGVPSSAGLPDLWLLIDGSDAHGGRVQRDLDELGHDWLELADWLTSSLRRYAARNFSSEKTVLRDSI